MSLKPRSITACFGGGFHLRPQCTVDRSRFKNADAVKPGNGGADFGLLAREFFLINEC
jgi:hypothetical protein